MKFAKIKNVFVILCLNRLENESDSSPTTPRISSTTANTDDPNDHRSTSKNENEKEAFSLSKNL